MNWNNLFYSFQFNDNLACYNKIKTIAAIKQNTFVLKRNGLLLLKWYIPQS